MLHIGISGGAHNHKIVIFFLDMTGDFKHRVAFLDQRCDRSVRAA
jgi:hypothetical protein